MAYTWNPNLALTDTAPLAGTGKTVYDWLGNTWGTDWANANPYYDTAWDQWRGSSSYTPSPFEDWQKLDFNIGYNRYYAEKIKPALDALAANPGADTTGPATDPGNPPPNPINWTLGGPGAVDINGTHYNYATWKVYDDGTLELVKDYSNMVDDIQNLPNYFAEQGLTSYQDWLKKKNITEGSIEEYLAAMATIAEQLGAGNLESDLTAADLYKAESMGLTPAQYQAMMADLSIQAYGKASDQPGFTPEQIATRQRMHRNDMRMTEKAFGKMLDNSLSSSNSRARALMEADGYLSQMRDSDLKFEFTMMEEEQALRQQNYDNTYRTWATMFQQGNMSSQQFLDNLRQNRALELQTVAAEASTVLQQNQHYLQTYTADLSAANMYLQAKFDSIALELGMDSTIYSQLADMYAVAMAPWQADLAEWTAQMDAYTAQQALIATYAGYDAQANAADSGVLTGVLNGIFTVISVIFGAFLGGPAPSSTTSTSSTQSGVGANPSGYRDEDF